MKTKVKTAKIIFQLILQISLMIILAVEANAICSINADLSCVDVRPSGQPTFPGISWVVRSPYERAVLFGSKDVQGNGDSCANFASIIKTECGITTPVQYVFRTKSTDTPIVGHIITESINMSKKPDLDDSTKKYFNATVGVGVDANLEKETRALLSNEQMVALIGFLDPRSTESSFVINMQCRSGQAGSINSLGCLYDYSCDSGTKLLITKRPMLSADYLCTKSNGLNSIYATLKKINTDRSLSVPDSSTDFVSFENMQMISVNNSALKALLKKKSNISLENWYQLRLPASMAMMGGAITQPRPGVMDGYVPIDLRKVCQFGEVTIAHGESIKTYEDAQAACSSVRTTVRVCNDGTLSPGFGFLTCGAQSSCEWDHERRPHGTTVIAYKNRLSPNCDSVKETRTCNNGKWSGSAESLTCRLDRGCMFDNVLMSSGSSVNAYLESTSDNCAGITTKQICENETLVGNRKSRDCGRPCRFNNKYYENRERLIAYTTKISTNCEKAKVSVQCLDGVVSGIGNIYPICQEPNKCYFAAREMVSGASVEAYSQAVADDCDKIKQTRICNDGILSGSFEYPSCRKTKSCEYKGKIFQNNESIPVYPLRTSSSCKSDARYYKCKDGNVYKFDLSINMGLTCGKGCSFTDSDGLPNLVDNEATVDAFSSEVSKDCSAIKLQRTCRDGLMSGDSKYKYGSCRSYKDCLWNGIKEKHGSNVYAYSIDIAENCSNVKVRETRVCQDGVWSGSFPLESCIDAKVCTFNGRNIKHGESIATYVSKNSSNCDSPNNKKMQKCNNGNLEWPQGYGAESSCGKPCSLADGTVVDNEATVDAFSSEVSKDCSAIKLQRTCRDGLMSGDSKYKYGSCRSYKDCLWNGIKEKHGSNVYAYSIDIAENCSNVKVRETRVCQDGVWSGSFPLESCIDAKVCTFNGRNIKHGESIATYVSKNSSNCDSPNNKKMQKCNNGNLEWPQGYGAESSCGKPCSLADGTVVENMSSITLYKQSYSSKCDQDKEIVKCENGVLTGRTNNYSFKSCIGVSCILDEKIISSGESIIAFSATAAADCKTVKQERTCTNGLLSGDAKYSFKSCGSLGCYWQGNKYAYGATINAYFDMYSDDCNANKETRTCINGDWTGSFKHTSCSPAKSCTFNGVRIAHRESVAAYSASNSTNCEAIKNMRRCYNGMLEGSNDFSTCTGGCTFGSKSIDEGSSVKAYTQSEALDCNSVKQMKTCNNGVLSGSALFEYCRNYPKCSLQGGLIMDGSEKTRGSTIVRYSTESSINCEDAKRTLTCNENGVWQGSLGEGLSVYKYTDCTTLSTCIFDGKKIAVGDSVTAYSDRANCGGRSKQTRTCREDGTMTGDAPYSTCISCIFDGKEIAVGGSVTAYSDNTNCGERSKQTRTCREDGTLTGSARYSKCSGR